MKRDACPSGAEEPRKSPCSLPRSRPSYCASAVMSLPVMPGLILFSTRVKTSSCISAALRMSPLFALDRLEAIDEFGRIHELGLAGELAFDARDEFVRHSAAGDPSDGVVAAPLEFVGDERGLVFVGIGDAGKGRREDHLPDATVGLVAAVDLAAPAARAHVDHGHQVRGGEDDAARIAVAQRRVGEPSDITAEPVVAVLHHQHVDLALRHGSADRGPAPFELARRNRIEQPFVHHLSSMLRNLWPRWSGAKPGTVLRCKSAPRRGGYGFVRARRAAALAPTIASCCVGDSVSVSVTNSTGLTSPTG